MSGKEQSGLEGKTEHKLDIQSTEEAELLSVDEIKIEIPTVMITKSDAESLLSTLASSSADGTQVRIDLTSYPSMLDTTYMGSESYPKLRVGRQVVHAVGDGQWGIASSSVNGREWQLYIMSAADTITMMFSFPLPAVTSGNQKVSTTFAASIDPLEIYHGMISRQCPTHIELDGDHVVIIKPTPEQ